MTHNAFVRYWPEVKRRDPTFDSALGTALDDVRRYISQPLPTAGGVRAVRDAHAKGYGLARAEVEILDGLPAEYAQGIYAGAPPAGQHHARAEGGLPPGIHPPPPVESPGSEGAGKPG